MVHCPCNPHNDGGWDKMYRLAICDDDKNFCSQLEKNLHGVFADRNIEYAVVSFNDIQSLDASLSDGSRYDLLFLDIMFDDGNGMSYAKRLRTHDYKFDIIFITISKEYAIESYDANPLYYLTKPIDQKKLTAAVVRFLEKNTPKYICFSYLGGTIKLKLSDIYYFEIYGHRVVIHKSDGTQADIRGTLKDIESQLPPKMFIRPHRSYLVNTAFITEIKHYNLKISNGELIPISRSLYNKAQLEFVDYLAEKELFV